MVNMVEQMREGEMVYNGKELQGLPTPFLLYI
jgi:hypothetical protein